LLACVHKELQTAFADGRGFTSRSVLCLALVPFRFLTFAPAKDWRLEFVPLVCTTGTWDSTLFVKHFPSAFLHFERRPPPPEVHFSPSGPGTTTALPKTIYLL